MSAEDRSGMSVGLTCRDMNKSLEFYRDRFGFEVKESWPDAQNPMWANMILGSQSVMLAGAMDPDKVDHMCGGDAAEAAHWRKEIERFGAHPSGIGVQVYLQVPDIDAYAQTVKGRGAKLEHEPKTQFYGIREVRVVDPDGYTLVFYTAVAMSSCQSCGMPLSDAEPGQMYCQYCVDESGHLRPYEQVFEGTVQGYFMGMQQMKRPDAEVAARDHLAKMPAWTSRRKD